MLFDDRFEGTGHFTLDFAKAMIDEGYHPMTMYFPLVASRAMLIELTESERARPRSISFVATLRDRWTLAAKAGDTADRFNLARAFAALPPPSSTAARAPKPKIEKLVAAE